MIKLKRLKSTLSRVRGFPKPNVALEQYMTPPDVAASMVFVIETQFGDISGMEVLDACCGTGMLSIASSFFDPLAVVGVDCCKDAVSVAARNCSDIGSDVSFVISDFASARLAEFDTVIMNPPFGTRTAHTDRAMVEKALSVGRRVYSLHKSSTRAYWLSRYGATVLASIKYDIPPTHSFHRYDTKTIDVDLIKFSGRRRPPL